MKLEEGDPVFRVVRAQLACEYRLIRILPYPDEETLAVCGQFFPDAIRELVDDVVKTVLSDPAAFRKELEPKTGEEADE